VSGADRREPQRSTPHFFEAIKKAAIGSSDADASLLSMAALPVDPLLGRAGY